MEGWVQGLIGGLEITTALVTWWRLRLRWGSEKGRPSALVAMSLLTLTLLFQEYGRYVLGAMPTHTADQFGAMLKVQGRYDARAWLLSVVALVACIIWRRSSKHLASGLALGLGIWMCLTFTLSLASS